ncbi:hypothetical protein D3C76_1085580 [compost metagenome]
MNTKILLVQLVIHIKDIKRVRERLLQGEPYWMGKVLVNLIMMVLIPIIISIFIMNLLGLILASKIQTGQDVMNRNQKYNVLIQWQVR